MVCLGEIMKLKNCSITNCTINYLHQFNQKKIIKDQLKIINPLLGKNEPDLKVHLKNALNIQLLTKSEVEFLELKMELGRMCLDLEQVLDGVFVSMVFYDRNRNFIFNGAAPSIPLDFFSFFNGINEEGLFNESCGSCGKGIFRKEVVNSDIQTCSLWKDYKDHALKFGFKSCTSVPFYTSEGRVTGTFAHYSTKPNHLLTEDQLVMIQEKTVMYQNEIHKISERLNEYTRIGKTGLTI